MRSYHKQTDRNDCSLDIFFVPHFVRYFAANCKVCWNVTHLFNTFDRILLILPIFHRQFCVDYHTAVFNSFIHSFRHVILFWRDIFHTFMLSSNLNGHLTKTMVFVLRTIVWSEFFDFSIEFVFQQGLGFTYRSPLRHLLNHPLACFCNDHYPKKVSVPFVQRLFFCCSSDRVCFWKLLLSVSVSQIGKVWR